MNGQYQQSRPRITEEYEEKVLAAFKAWYHQAQPTIEQASTQAYIVARETVGGLTEDVVLLLLVIRILRGYMRPHENDMTAIVGASPLVGLPAGISFGIWNTLSLAKDCSGYI